MRYVVVLFVLFLVGCGNGDAESFGITIGEQVYVDRGFYKGCRGMVTDYSDYNSIDDMVTIQEARCETVTVSNFRTEAKNIRKK
jgi:ribosomal protein L24